MMTAQSPSAAQQQRRNWMTNLYRMLHLDYHQPPWMRGVAAALNEELAGQQARAFREAGVQAVEIFAHDHYGQCFYPSNVGITHPGLAADYTGLMARALKAEGIRVILYLNVFTSVHLHRHHPDWFVRAEDGSYPPGAWLQHPASHICASSPYLEEYFVPLVQEAVRRHEPDAIWLDAGSWMIEAVCHCENCQRRYRAATGADLPRGAMPGALEELDRPDWTTWRLWRRSQIDRYLLTVVPAIKAVNPDVLVTDNNVGRFSTNVPPTENGKLVAWLAPSDLGVDYLSCDPVPMGGNHELILSIEGRYQWTTGLPFNYMNERFNGWGEWQFRSPTDWSLEAATIVANGGRCFFADQPYPDGTLEPSVYHELGAIYDRVRRLEPCLRDAEPVADVAILASPASGSLGPHGGVEWGRRLSLFGTDVLGAAGIPNMGGARTDRVRGGHLALIEGGIQTLIFDEASLRAHLSDQSAVIVPEQCLLEEATIEALRGYVQEGGRVLLTGRSGWWDEAGHRRATDSLAELLGLERRGLLPAPIHYLRPNPAWSTDTALGDVPLQLWGSAVAVELTSAEPLAMLYEPRPEVWRDGIRDRAHWQHYTVFGAAPPNTSVAGPGVTINSYGKGRVLYLSVDPFALYFEEGHHLARALILACLNELLPPAARVLMADKPLHVELVVARQEGRILVHVLNYFAQKRLGALVNNDELTPVHDIRVRVRTDSEPKQVLLAPEGGPLEFEHAGAWTTVRLPRLDTHAVIVLER
jgi:hypothetical protein